MGKLRPSWALEQGRFVGTWDPNEEVLLEFTVPLSATEEHFRVGWSLKGLGHSGWIAMTTGQAVWSQREMSDAAEHIRNLLEACAAVVRGGSPEDRH